MVIESLFPGENQEKDIYKIYVTTLESATTPKLMRKIFSYNFWLQLKNSLLK